MILVLAEPSDAPALWLARRLTLRHAVRVVTPTQLLCSPCIIQRLSRNGDHFAFRLADGAYLARDTVHGVVNRLLAVPDAHLQAAVPGERAYAHAELWAFLLGWLAGLEVPVLNPADPSGLAGPWRSTEETAYLAALAGLPVRLGARQRDPASPAVASVFVLDGRVIGRSVPAEIRDAVLRFAALWGGRLLQVDFDAAPQNGVVCSATSFVDFPRGGDLLAGHISQALCA